MRIFDWELIVFEIFNIEFHVGNIQIFRSNSPPN